MEEEVSDQNTGVTAAQTRTTALVIVSFLSVEGMYKALLVCKGWEEHRNIHTAVAVCVGRVLCALLMKSSVVVVVVAAAAATAAATANDLQVVVVVVIVTCDL